MLKECSGVGDTGVIEQQMYGSVGLEGRVCERLDLSFVGDVHSVNGGVSAEGLYLFGGLLQARLIHISECDVTAFLGQRIGEFAANSAGGSCDCGDTSLECIHEGSLGVGDHLTSFFEYHVRSFV